MRRVQSGGALGGTQLRRAVNLYKALGPACALHYLFTRKVLVRVPRSWGEEAFERLFWALHPRRKDLSVEEKDELFEVRVGSSGLYVPDPERKWMLSWGVGARLWIVEDKYSLPDRVAVERGDVVCDVGAFIGEFSLAIADRASRVFAFEPDPTALACLRKNARSYPNVSVRGELIWDKDEPVKFHLASAHADSSAFRKRDSSYGTVVKQGVPLDSALSPTDIEQIDFLKVEAEGAEPEVLAGAARVLQTVNQVAVDVGAERAGTSTGPEVTSILTSHGFTVVRRANVVFAWREA